MSPSSLLLSHPIPRDSIELGRLVLDVKYPNHDFCQPRVPLDYGHETPKTATSAGFLFGAGPSAVSTQRFENFHEAIEGASDRRLHASLLNVLSFSPSNPKNTSATVTGPLCTIHELRDSTAYFAAACCEPRVRSWLEAQSRRPLQSVYLVCGLKTVTDANVELAMSRGSEADFTVGVSGSQIATAAGMPVPLPSALGLDVEAGLHLRKDFREKSSYNATGEQVFAVQYRKVSFAWFSRSKVDRSYLERGNHWQSTMNSRAVFEGEEDSVDAELGDPITPSDLDYGYEGFDFDGETILIPRAEALY